MRIQSLDPITALLVLLGFGYLFQNARLAYGYMRFLRLRRSAILTWRIPKPPLYAFSLGIGVALGVLVFVKVVFIRRQAFGELMMFAYSAYLSPMSLTIGRGFYEDGLRPDTAFIPYQQVGGISWREDEQQVSLIVISRLRNLARRL